MALKRNDSSHCVLSLHLLCNVLRQPQHASDDKQRCMQYLCSVQHQRLDLTTQHIYLQGLVKVHNTKAW
eukprot:scaffold323374_cov20-Prasinocladus_malaysianus.AAC.1